LIPHFVARSALVKRGIPIDKFGKIPLWQRTAFDQHGLYRRSGSLKSFVIGLLMRQGRD
jgi:hypothetical protein